MIPFIVLGSLHVGGIFVTGSMPLTIDFEHISWQALQTHLLQYIVGSLILATFTAVILGITVYALLSYYYRKKTKNV